MRLSKDKTKILFLTHYYFRVEGGGDTDERIVNYFKNKAKKIVLVTNPFPESDSNISFCFVYENGQKTKELKVAGIKGNTILQFLSQFLTVYFLLLKVGVNYDLCIAANNFSFMIIFPLRFLCIIRRLIFYSIDFVPRRFPNQILDWFYHSIYKLACEFSDTNWVMTKKQIEVSKTYNIIPSKDTPFDLVPIGYETKDIKVLSVENIDFYNIVYMGGLRESHGPQLAIEAMPILIKKNPKIHLTIVGGGRYGKYLKSLARKLKVEKNIDFTGYIEKFQDLTNLLVTKSIGLAPYKPVPGSFSYYSDPSKIKLYLVCGLPVITTNMATMADIIIKTKSGIVTNYSAKDLADSVFYLLNNREKYISFKEAAFKLSSRFDINFILGTAIKKIPN